MTMPHSKFKYRQLDVAEAARRQTAKPVKAGAEVARLKIL